MEFIEALTTTTIPLADITLEKVVFAAIIAVIGWIVVKVLITFFRRLLSRASHLPILVVEFLVRFFSLLLYVILLLLVIA
ncbi:MAG: mechanosensitive ion channel family protein, partial [Methanomicrobiales archaeon]|nr:mechanosensitive ion channel family protein [Methanomicrobiales archaeon]